MQIAKYPIKDEWICGVFESIFEGNLIFKEWFIWYRRVREERRKTLRVIHLLTFILCMMHAHKTSSCFLLGLKKFSSFSFYYCNNSHCIFAIKCGEILFTTYICTCGEIFILVQLNCCLFRTAANVYFTILTQIKLLIYYLFRLIWFQ